MKPTGKDRRGVLKTQFTTIGAGLFLVLCSLVVADKWDSSCQMKVNSWDGRFYAAITPSSDPATSNSPPTAAVFRSGEEYPVLWRVSLRNDDMPVAAFLSPDGRNLVTLDDWGCIGRGTNVLVMYRQEGKSKGYDLETLLGRTTAELTTLFEHSVSSRLWDEQYVPLWGTIDGEQAFGLWLAWRRRWLFVRANDGTLLQSPSNDALDHWNSAAEKRARSVVSGKDARLVTALQSSSETPVVRYRRAILAGAKAFLRERRSPKK